MNKIIILAFCFSLVSSLSLGQGSFTLRGKISAEDQESLMGASIVLYPIEKAAIANKNGNYLITNIPEGKYKIEISFISYSSLIDSITINSDMEFNAILKPANQNLQEVLVTYHRAETRKKEESLNIEIVNDDYLQQNRAGSIMKSLERLPGVATIDIGAGQSKPVIRGLGFNRVLVIENNIRHEAQQWGIDHGLEIDQYAVEDIEIIKGPSSLMYGSDAIGGVIKINSNNLPARNTIGGSIDLTGRSNNDFLGTSLSLYGRKDWFFAEFRATILDYGDYKVPTDSVDIYSYRIPLYNNHLRNTAGNENNFHLNFGFIQKKFQSKFYISQVNSKGGLFANAHGLEPQNVDADFHDKSNRDINYPYQQVKHFKLINISHYHWAKFKIESNIGLQRNNREEWSRYTSHGWMPALFPDTMIFDPDLERQFDKYVYSTNLNVGYEANKKTHLNFGIDSEYQENEINGRGFIIPSFDQFNIGGFALAKFKTSTTTLLSLGVRYDHGQITTLEYLDWFKSPLVENGDTSFINLQRGDNIERRFSNISWSAGYNYNPKNWALKINIGKSFRMPIAKELAANGVNYHRFSFEKGNSDLDPEVSYQLDAGIEYSSTRFAIGATPFLNYFPNYIYLNPTSEHDRLYGNGNQVYYYTQSEVLRFGGEIHMHYELLKSLELGVMGEYVYSEQLSGAKKGFSLPFSPPAAAIFNIKYQKQKIGSFEKAYLSLDYKLAAAQNNIVPPEKITEGYHVFNLALGGEIKLLKQKLKLSLQWRNILNNKYFNHTSYYRLINIPEPGRSLIINLSIPFSIKPDKKQTANNLKF